MGWLDDDDGKPDLMAWLLYCYAGGETPEPCE
jgi:hypothetical protein